MPSPITSSDFENQTPGQSLCEAFQEKLLNNSKMQQLLDYFFDDETGDFTPGFFTDIIGMMPAIGGYVEFPVPLPTATANPDTGVVYVEANGQELLRADYAKLFSLIGTTFNQDDDTDVTKFRVPDRSDKFSIGRSSSRAYGVTGGSETHELTIDELPPHGHEAFVGVSDGSFSGRRNCLQTNAGGSYAESNTASSDPYIQPVGGDNAEEDPKAVPHSNMPPYIASVVYIVAGYKVAGTFI